MDTPANSSNTTVAPTTPAAPDSNKAAEVAGQLLTGVTSFAQEAEQNRASLTMLLNQIGQSISAIDAKAEQNRAHGEKLASWIENNRS
jgi:hypothetical protein